MNCNDTPTNLCVRTNENKLDKYSKSAKSEFNNYEYIKEQMNKVNTQFFSLILFMFIITTNDDAFLSIDCWIVQIAEWIISATRVFSGRTFVLHFSYIVNAESKDVF